MKMKHIFVTGSNEKYSKKVIRNYFGTIFGGTSTLKPECHWKRLKALAS